MPRWLVAFTVFFTVLLVSSRGQFLATDVDTQTRNDAFSIDRVYSGNTPFLRFYVYEDGVPFLATNWNWYFKYGTNLASGNMVTMTATETLSNRVDFIGNTNTFGQANDDWFCELVASHKTNSLHVVTWGQGRLIEIASPGAGTTTNLIFGATLNWNTITTYAGRWPIYSTDTTVLTVTESGTGVVLNVISGSGTLTGWRGTNGLTGGGASGSVTGEIDYGWLVSFLATNTVRGAITNIFPSGGLLSITTNGQEYTIALTTGGVQQAITESFLWKTNAFAGAVTGTYDSLNINTTAVATAMDGRYVNASGDLMTGALTIHSNSFVISNAAADVTDYGTGGTGGKFIARNNDGDSIFVGWDDGNRELQVMKASGNTIARFIGSENINSTGSGWLVQGGLSPRSGFAYSLGSTNLEWYSLYVGTIYATNGLVVSASSGGSGGGDRFRLSGSGALATNWNAGGNTISNATFVGDGSGVTNIGSSSIASSISTNITARLSSNAWTAADSTTNYTKRTGDTMSGPLTNGGGIYVFDVGVDNTNFVGLFMGVHTNSGGDNSLAIAFQDSDAEEAYLYMVDGGELVYGTNYSNTGLGHPSAIASKNGHILYRALTNALSSYISNWIYQQASAGQVIRSPVAIASNFNASTEIIMLGRTNLLGANLASNGTFAATNNHWSCDTCSFSVNEVAVFPPNLTSTMTFTSPVARADGAWLSISFDLINYATDDSVRVIAGGHTNRHTGFNSVTQRVTSTLSTHDSASGFQIEITTASTNYAYVDNVTCAVVNATGQYVAVAGHLDVSGDVTIGGRLNITGYVARAGDTMHGALTVSNAVTVQSNLFIRMLPTNQTQQAMVELGSGTTNDFIIRPVDYTSVGGSVHTSAGVSVSFVAGKGRASSSSGSGARGGDVFLLAGDGGAAGSSLSQYTNGSGGNLYLGPGLPGATAGATTGYVGGIYMLGDVFFNTPGTSALARVTNGTAHFASYYAGEALFVDGQGKLQTGVATNSATDGYVLVARGSNYSHEVISASVTGVFDSAVTTTHSPTNYPMSTNLLGTLAGIDSRLGSKMGTTNDSVTSAQIQGGAIGNAEMAAGAVAQSNIVAGSIGASRMNFTNAHSAGYVPKSSDSNTFYWAPDDNSGGGGSQSPWTNTVDAAGKQLIGVGSIIVSSNNYPTSAVYAAGRPLVLAMATQADYGTNIFPWVGAGSPAQYPFVAVGDRDDAGGTCYYIHHISDNPSAQGEYSWYRSGKSGTNLTSVGPGWWLGKLCASMMLSNNALTQAGYLRFLADQREGFFDYTAGGSCGMFDIGLHAVGSDSVEPVVRVMSGGFIGIGITNNVKARLHLYGETNTWLRVDGPAGYQRGIHLAKENTTQWRIILQTNAEVEVYSEIGSKSAMKWRPTSGMVEFGQGVTNTHVYANSLEVTGRLVFTTWVYTNLTDLPSAAVPTNAGQWGKFLYRPNGTGVVYDMLVGVGTTYQYSAYTVGAP